MNQSDLFDYATELLKKAPTRNEFAIAEYKGVLGQLGKVKKADKIMRILNEYYKRLKNEK